MPARRYRVDGRVQGVFFRANTQKVAQGEGLSGYAKNLPDGGVEVVAQGSREALERLEAFLRQGPAAARVDTLDQEEIAEGVWEGFRIDSH